MAHDKDSKIKKIAVLFCSEMKKLFEMFSDNPKAKSEFTCSGNVRIMATYTMLKLLGAQNPKSKEDLRIHLKNMKEFNEGEIAKQIINHFVNNKIKGENE